MVAGQLSQRSCDLDPVCPWRPEDSGQGWLPEIVSFVSLVVCCLFGAESFIITFRVCHGSDV